jgi:hypothetical protein
MMKGAADAYKLYNNPNLEGMIVINMQLWEMHYIEKIKQLK